MLYWINLDKIFWSCIINACNFQSLLKITSVNCLEIIQGESLHSIKTNPKVKHKLVLRGYGVNV